MVLDRYVAALDEARFIEAFAEGRGVAGRVVGRSGADEPHDRHPRLLRPCRKRPCRRAAGKRDELAASNHSITSSARVSMVGGTMRPSALAVLRFTAISNFVGNCTGRSPGFSPRRMRSTYEAAR